MIRMSGPNVYVNWSMNSSRIQKKKQVPAKSQSKWNLPLLDSFSTVSRNYCDIVGLFLRRNPRLHVEVYYWNLINQMMIQMHMLKSKNWVVRMVKILLVSFE